MLSTDTLSFYFYKSLWGGGLLAQVLKALFYRCGVWEASQARSHGARAGPSTFLRTVGTDERSTGPNFQTCAQKHGCERFRSSFLDMRRWFEDG